ncbi:PAS domain-containing protein [Undibacterium piscinae]|uniref:PAS domain-containing protein n=1 Tax=Undibacterium piscinae TaxID=2495591 RepID=A0A6M4A633_9BURK|nr:PAS domain-containing protein [Undibacterium piscinae]
MLGYTKDELPAVYQSVERLLHPDDRALLKQKLLAHFKHGENMIWNYALPANRQDIGISRLKDKPVLMEMAKR